MIKNIFSNVGGYVVSVVVAFLIAPITIHTLGNARYGAWSLVSELIGYYGLLDLGIRGAVTYHVAKYASVGQQSDVEETLASAFWFLALCGLLAFSVGVGFTIGFPYLFKVAGMDLLEIQQSLLIMSALIAFSLPMNVFAGALIGKQRFDISSGLEVANRILTALMVYVVLKLGGGLVALAIVQAVGRVISWGATLIACRRVIGGIFIWPALVKLQRLQALLKYGFRNSLGQVALLVIYRMDLVVVGMFAGVERVIYYSLASTLVSYASNLCSNITFVFTPRFTQLQSLSSDHEAQELFFSGTRIAGMVVVALTAGLLVFGKDFIRLWVGEAYVTGPWTDRSDLIMTTLILANLPRMLQGITWQRLYGTGRVRFLMWLNICEAAANLSLSILFGSHFGPIGVAFGTLLPLLTTQIFILPAYSCRVFGISLSTFITKSLATPVLVGLLMLAGNLAFVRFVPPTTWKLFFIDVVAAVSLGAVICVMLGLTKSEKGELLTRLQRAIS